MTTAARSPSPRSVLTGFWQPRQLLRRLLSVQAIGLLVAVLLTLQGGGPFFASWVYSALIATNCWLAIDLGRRVVAAALLRWTQPRDTTRLAHGWPGWIWMGVLIVLMVPLAYAGGAWLGDLITGQRSITGISWGRGWAGVTMMSMLVASITTWFFYARSRIADAETEIATVARQATETRLKLLEAQLEPHMLFNTLANLRVLIGIDAVRAQDMLDHLIDYLRATLGASRGTLHPLSAEYARLADYLALMKIRMGDRLATELDLPPDLADAELPTLLLQPLVENAIKHGLEPKRGGGLLRVSASAAGDVLEVLVHDSGVGPAPVDGPAGSGAPRTSPHGTPDGGFGLEQVRARLATLYAEAGSVALQPAPGGGTDVRVTLPLRRHAGGPEAATPAAGHVLPATDLPGVPRP